MNMAVRVAVRARAGDALRDARSQPMQKEMIMEPSDTGSNQIKEHQAGKERIRPASEIGKPPSHEHDGLHQPGGDKQRDAGHRQSA